MNLYRTGLRAMIDAFPYEGKIVRDDDLPLLELIYLHARTGADHEAGLRAVAEAARGERYARIRLIAERALAGVDFAWVMMDDVMSDAFLLPGWTPAPLPYPAV
jgi:hypothetical protein